MSIGILQKKVKDWVTVIVVNKINFMAHILIFLIMVKNL